MRRSSFFTTVLNLNDRSERSFEKNIKNIAAPQATKLIISKLFCGHVPRFERRENVHHKIICFSVKWRWNSLRVYRIVCCLL
jgi:hypothetical protein